MERESESFLLSFSLSHSLPCLVRILSSPGACFSLSRGDRGRAHARMLREQAPKEKGILFFFSSSNAIVEREGDDEKEQTLTLAHLSLSLLALPVLSLSSSTMPPRRGRAAAATAETAASAAAPFDEAHNNENEAAPLASSKQAPTAAKAAQNANAAPSFSTPKLALRTFSRRKPAAEVRNAGPAFRASEPRLEARQREKRRERSERKKKMRTFSTSCRATLSLSLFGLFSLSLCRLQKFKKTRTHPRSSSRPTQTSQRTAPPAVHPGPRDGPDAFAGQGPAAAPRGAAAAGCCGEQQADQFLIVGRQALQHLKAFEQPGAGQRRIFNGVAGQ